MPDERSFGRRLRERRKALDLTQEALGERVGCAAETIRRFEGDRLRPSRETAERLAAHLQLPSDERVAFVRAARGQPASHHAPTAPGGHTDEDAQPVADGHRRHNLPVQHQPLLGRAHDVAVVAALLRRQDVGLLTLTGPGGVGKTRLALAVAAEQRTTFRDGVWFVPLAPLSDPHLVISTIAQTLGLIEHGGQAVLDTVQAVLGPQHLLLVLDKFEHLLPAAPVVSALLAAAPHLTVLTTSRTRLHLYNEHIFEVPPLALPEQLAHSSAEAVQQAAAVQLFVARVQAVQPQFRLTAEHAGTVSDICRRLDGLPLAIELAAARSRLLPPPALLARLQQRLVVLTRGAQDQPARHQTLRAAIAWSYQLLDVAQQRLFRQLGVFAGGWTVESATAVCGGADTCDAEAGAEDVLAGLEELLDQSLIRMATSTDGTARFTMLETLREYALEQLHEAGEADAVGQRHAAYVGALAAQAEPWLGGPEPGAWLQRLRAEHSNVRAALTWLYEREETEAALALASALWLYWHMQGYLQEGRTWLERGLAANDAAAPTRAKALLRAGWLAWIQGDFASADALLERALELCRGLDDADGMARALTYQGFVSTTGQYRLERIPQLVAEALTLQPALADKRTEGFLVIFAGLAAAATNDVPKAYAWYVQALALFRETGHRFGQSMALTVLGLMAVSLHEYATAAGFLREELVLSSAIEQKLPIQYMLFGLGAIAAAQEQPLRAARLWGASEAIREQSGIHLSEAAEVQVNYAATVALAEQEAGPAAFHTAWAHGRAMTLEQAVAYALDASADDASAT